MSRRNRLEEAFDIDGGSELDDISRDEMEELAVEIPEIKNLQLIAELALDAYKEIWNNVHLYAEPRDRLKQTEVAHKYLNEAKDAIHKRDKLVLEERTKSGKSDSKEKDSETPSNGISRSALAEKAKAMRMKQ